MAESSALLENCSIEDAEEAGMNHTENAVEERHAAVAEGGEDQTSVNTDGVAMVQLPRPLEAMYG